MPLKPEGMLYVREPVVGILPGIRFKFSIYRALHMYRCIHSSMFSISVTCW
jgi:hypothetical protein